MITKNNEKWFAKGSYPDCNCIYSGNTKEELKAMLIEELIKFERSKRIYKVCGKRKMTSYCLQCEKEIVKLIKELDESPIE